jgi:hypothetical protein
VALLGVAACNASLPEPESPGARLYTERCSGCHRLYAPQTMKPEMWRITVKRMQGEMARRGVKPLDESETAVLLSYLEHHSG